MEFKRHNDMIAKLGRIGVYAGFKRHDKLVLRHEREIKRLR